MRLSLVLALFGFAVAIVPATPEAIAGASVRKQIIALRAKATESMRAGRYIEARRYFAKLRSIAPENYSIAYDEACAEALAGATEAAFAALDRAVTFGWSDRESVETTDDDLASLRSDPRLAAQLERISQNKAAAQEAYRQPWYVPPSTDSVPRFRTVREFTRAYKKREAELGELDLKRPGTRSIFAWRALRNEKVAAAQRLIESTRGRERERAYQETADAFFALRGDRVIDHWGEAGTALAQVAERYLAEFPTGRHRAEMRYNAALGRWYGRSHDQDTETEAAATPDQFAAADADFAAICAAHPGSDYAARAALTRLILAHDADGERITPTVQARYRELQPYLTDQRFRRFATFRARNIFFKFRDLSQFRGVDLQGKTWDLESMRGSVVLIEFWATWCGPCVAEFPTIKKAYDEYRARGFQIVGVSLDDDDRNAFTTWLTKHDAPWPQIYDGKGWLTPLARLFDVTAIPFEVLLDRDGTVVAVGLRGDELPKALAKLFGDPATSGAAAKRPSS